MPVIRFLKKYYVAQIRGVQMAPSIVLFRVLAIFTFFYAALPRASAQSTVPLYPGVIPHAIPGPDEETGTTDDIAKVSRPTLSVFLPPKEKGNGTAVIICPGGGYGTLVLHREGYAVAKMFVAMGITAFVLKYRLPDHRVMRDKALGPLQDAQQAIKYVRAMAAVYNLDVHKIGILGFSAGGHLAASAGTHFNRQLIENKEGISLRPDFMILVYPVISFTANLVHKGSMTNLLGPGPSSAQKRYFSNELQVTDATPPAFLVHANDDVWVPPGNSIRFFEALRKHSVSAELHIYSRGQHGFLTYPPPEEWLGRCRNWMLVNEFISR